MAAVVLFLITAFSPPALIGHLIVFVLAIVIGYYVIGNVHHALHTPLMSVTNAISGIIVVGALLQIGQPSLVITLVAFAAILLASINIFGGFAVTRRMLAMFSQRSLTTHDRTVRRQRRLHRRRAAVHPQPRRAVPARDRPGRRRLRHRRHGARAGRHARAGVAAGISALRLALLIVAMVIGAAIGLFGAARVSR